jgi:hypothetical protein
MIGRLAIIYRTGLWGVSKPYVTTPAPAGRKDALALIQLSGHLSDSTHWWWAKSPMPNSYNLDQSRRMQMQLIWCAEALWSEINWADLNDTSHCLPLSHLPVIIAGFDGQHPPEVANPGAI